MYYTMATVAAHHCQGYTTRENGQMYASQRSPSPSGRGQNFAPPGGFQTQRSQLKINARLGGHAAPTLRSVHIHHPYGGSAEGPCNALIPPHVCTDFRRSYGVTHGTTWGLCTHPACPQGITPSLTKAGTLIDLT